MGIDIGANTGEFSELLARHAERVIAVDSDPACLDALYQASKQGNQKIAPLGMDYVTPTPGVGWNNSERRSFFHRFKGSDFLLALGILHHLRIGGNVPLTMILDSFSSLADRCIVEWVPKSDSMCQALLARKQDTYTDYTEENFRTLACKHFKVEQTLTLANGRVLYYLKKANAR